MVFDKEDKRIFNNEDVPLIQIRVIATRARDRSTRESEQMKFLSVSSSSLFPAIVE